MKSLSALLGVSILLLAASAAAQDAGAPPPADADAGAAEAPPPADDGAAGAMPADTGEPSDATPPTAAPPPVTPAVDAAAQFTAAATLDHPATDETVWNIAAGATLSTGNTRAFAGNVGTHFAVRRGSHAVAGDFQFIEGYAQVRNAMMGPDMGTFRGTNWAENAQNIAGNARYDYFFDADNALFVSLLGRHDEFAGLAFRGQAQVGYLRNFYAVEHHRLWGEIGYDFTYDYFANKTIHDPTTGAPLQTDRMSHSARFFVGYDNHLNELLTLTTGLELLLRPYAVAMQGDFQARLNWITQLNMKVDTHFSLSLNFTLRYDSVPPGYGTMQAKDELDTVTVLSLIYTLI